MITWMQTHKKWLIITIWIATIAFVGAGFVGWGAYSYGKKQDEVARIKDTSVKVKDVQEIYNQLFNQINQAMNGKLDEATAKQLGLQTAAFKKAIQKAMLIQFAKDNGLYITDEELAKTISYIPLFQKDGKFDKNLYSQYLRNIGLTPKEFEANIRKDILVEKIIKALNLKSSKTLQDTIAADLLMSDKVEAKQVTIKNLSITDEEIKKYWEQHKEKYKSELSYNIGYFYVVLNTTIKQKELVNYYDEHKQNYTDATGKILPFDKVKEQVKKDLMAKKTKKEAIITMKKLKNNQLKFKELNNTSLNNNVISQENMTKIIQNKFLKPTITPKGWLIAKLIKINKPVILDYNKAKALAKIDALNQKRKNLLMQIAKRELKGFKGKNYGFISKEDVTKFKSLSVDEAATFINKLFTASSASGFVLLPQETPNKVMLFRIKEQKLLDDKKYKKYSTLIIDFADKLKSEQLQKNLQITLEKLYQGQTKIYIKF